MANVQNKCRFNLYVNNSPTDDVSFQAFNLSHPKLNLSVSCSADSGTPAGMAAVTKLECTVCKKKFKNLTSLNYHEMFHTQEERDEVLGAPAHKPVAEADSGEESDSEEETFKKIKVKKNRPKDGHKSKPQPAKVTDKRLSEASEDSDNACDSNYLSLKHISMSIKKQDERRGARPQDLLPKPTAIKAEAKRTGTPPARKVKFTCDQCKKKFSDALAMEYHKITFHVDCSPPSPKPPAKAPHSSVE